MNMKKKETEYVYKIILHPNLCNWLLKNGFRISKVKASRQHANHTVFVFEIEKNCMQLFFDCMNKFDKTRARNNEEKFVSYKE